MSTKDELNQQHLEIKKTITIDASPEVIFKALTNIDDLTQWFPDQGTFEAKVGGKMHFTFLADVHKMEKDRSLDGEVLELVRNKKLVHSFIPDDSYRPDDIRTLPTTVTWILEEIGKNKTQVTLIHSGFTKETPKHFKEATGGWSYFTTRLIKYCKKISKP
jgi:uncharacterized protein YndB with AHSA1/START domain